MPGKPRRSRSRRRLRAAPNAAPSPRSRPGAAVEPRPGGPAEAESPWLLLLHQLPAKPDYLRVKIWRRMQRVGAVALKNAVWALPAIDQAREDFQWLAGEIETEGGEALLCEARFLAGLSEDQRAALTRAANRRSGRAAPPGPPVEPTRFGPAGVDLPRGRVWVTRRDVHVDRMASAWLIRRRIDPAARFRFVAPDGYRPSEGEIRFDMYQAEYTHVGDSCTLETLASSFVPGDPAVAAIAQLVHDIDCKDERFGRPESAGVERLIEGITLSHSTDEARLERGFPVFDDLYAAFRARLNGGGTR